MTAITTTSADVMLAKLNALDGRGEVSLSRFEPSIEPSNRETRLQKQGLKPTLLSDFLTEPEPETRWLVDELLPAGGTSLFAGPPKAGKTTALLDLAHCVVKGQPFVGRTTTAGRVLLVLLDDKRGEMRNALARQGLTGNEPLYIHIGPVPADPIAALRAQLSELKPEFVAIDTLMRFVAIQDANDYSQVTRALEPLTELAREYGTHILVTHHRSKAERSDATSVLGSTALFAMVDTLLLMSRHDQTRTLKSVNRYGRDLEEVVLERDEETGLLGVGGSYDDTRIEAMAARIVRLLEDSPEPQTEEDIRRAIGGNESVVARALRWAAGHNRVTKDGKGRRGNPYRYRASDSRFSVFPQDLTEKTNSEETD